MYRAIHTDGQEIAAKQIEWNTIMTHRDTTERELMAAFQVPKHHQNIIEINRFFKDEVEDEQNRKVHDYWIMMELCEHGNLNEYFRNNPLKFDNITVKLDLMCQIMCGLEYLHSQKVIHRDIKPGNILIGKDPHQADQVVVKISDFGLSKYLDPYDSASSMSSNVGTQNFKAPEFWARAPDAKLHYNKSVDIFAAGLTFLSMIQPMGENGLLTPRIEGAQFPGEFSNPIGLTMFNRRVNDQRPVRLVIEMPALDRLANLIRRIVREATLVEPDERLTAGDMLEEFTRLATDQDVSLSAEPIQEGMDSAFALPEPMDIAIHPSRDAQNMDHSGPHSFSTNMNANNSNDLPVINGQWPLVGPYINAGLQYDDSFYGVYPNIGAHPHFQMQQMKSSIPQKLIMEIASSADSSSMTRFAIMYLDINHTTIQRFKSKWREDITMVNFDILNTWVGKHPEPDAQQTLYQLFCKASRKGNMSPAVYQCLK